MENDRKIVGLEELVNLLPLSKWQIYKKVRDKDNPIPYKKAGKRILFDMDCVYKWFDDLPGSY